MDRHDPTMDRHLGLPTRRLSTRSSVMRGGSAGDERVVVWGLGTDQNQYRVLTHGHIDSAE